MFICCFVPNVQPTVCANVYGSEIRSVHFRKIDAINRFLNFLQNVQPTICVNVYGSEIRNVHFRKINAITRIIKFLQFDAWFIQYAHPTFLVSATRRET
jgi:hypothetical protein